MGQGGGARCARPAVRLALCALRNNDGEPLIFADEERIAPDPGSPATGLFRTAHSARRKTARYARPLH